MGVPAFHHVARADVAGPNAAALRRPAAAVLAPGGLRAGACAWPAKLGRRAGCRQMNQDLWPGSGLRRPG